MRVWPTAAANQTIRPSPSPRARGRRQQFAADIHDMCPGVDWNAGTGPRMGEIPVLVGSCLCHRPAGALSCYFDQRAADARAAVAHCERTVQGDCVAGAARQQPPRGLFKGVSSPGKRVYKL